jgi:hypothetical protein
MAEAVEKTWNVFEGKAQLAEKGSISWGAAVNWAWPPKRWLLEEKGMEVVEIVE